MGDLPLVYRKRLMPLHSARLLVFAYMLSPDDEASAMTYAQLHLIGLPSVLRTRCLSSHSRAGRFHGSMAGNVFLARLQLAMFCEKPTLEKAQFLVAESAKEEKRTEAGRQIPFNVDAIRRIWRRYQSASHLWGAYCLLQEEEDESFELVQGAKAYPSFRRFLALAEALLDTANDHNFILRDPWRVPAAFPLRALKARLQLAAPDAWTRQRLSEFVSRHS